MKKMMNRVPALRVRWLLLRSLPACTALLVGACAMGASATPDQRMPAASVTLQRTSCFGSCPSYTVTVTQDGQVSFEGLAHVQSGSASGHATPAQVANILAAVKEARLRSMRDSYVAPDDGCEMVMSDQAGVKITVVDAAGSKTVDFYKGCTGASADAVRPRIEQLASSIDQQLGTARWIGKPAARGGVEKAER
jgi:hypothetical protein